MVALADPEWYIRFEAARELGASGDPSGIPALVGSLCDCDVIIRFEVSQAIKRLGETVPPPLLAATTRTLDAEVLHAAVPGIEEFGRREAVRPLRLALHQGDWNDLPWATAVALGSLALFGRFPATSD